MEEETKRKLRLKELELKQSSSKSASHKKLEINKCIGLFPPFNEKDAGKYFTLFERTNNTSQWSKEVWPILLQSVFTGKAQDA